MSKHKTLTKLGDIGKVLMCKRVLKCQTASTGEIPFFKISTFGGDADTFISQDLYAEYKRKYSHPKKGDVLISAAGTVGKTVIYDGKPAYFQDSNIVWIENLETKVLNSYLYYFYQTEPWLTTKGSTINRIYNNDLRSIEFSYPSLTEQKKISKVLQDLDEKIELNNKISAELEAMAKLIYDYWFVQFDFPDANGKPYKSTGGKIVYNEELKREIPKGWGNSKLEDYISLEYGKPLTKQLRSGSGYPVVGSSGVIDLHAEFLVQGPGIVVGRKGTVGAVTYLHGNFYPIDTTYFVKTKLDIKYLFLKHLLDTLNLSKMNSDSAVPGLNRESALGVNVISIPVEIIKLFENIASPLFDKIALTSEQNRELIELRDWLLPMLMNGQVTVKDSYNQCKKGKLKHGSSIF